jgi:protein-tyrosine-phosphatase
MTDHERVDADRGGESDGDAPPFRLLFVCTGNTCRSPLAEALARRYADERGWVHLEVGSAGVAAGPGQPASGGSLDAAKEVGLDLSGHASTSLTAELVDASDLILVMSPHHLMRVVDLGGGGRATLLTAFAAGREGEDAFDAPSIPDPFGGPLEEYVRTRDRLDTLVRQVLDRLEPVLAP